MVRATPNNRVVTISKLGFGGLLPKRYVEEIREFPGVRAATLLAFTAFKLPGRDDLFFGSGAVDAPAFIDMHKELSGSEEGKQAFVQDPRGALATQDLVDELGWKVGDRLIFESRLMPGTWEFELRGIAESTRAGWGQRNVWVHYDHFNKSQAPERRDQVFLIAAEVFEPNQGGRISKAIDRHFDTSQFRTLTREDHVMWAANQATFSAIVTAMNVVSYLFLVVVACVLANALGISVRERTRELGVMRALGFAPSRLVRMVLAEALLLGVVGGLMGLAISYPLFEGLVSRVLQETNGFQPIKIHPRAAAGALVLSVVMSLVAAGVPCYRVGRLRVTEALARLG
jgi:putative ABC transport system permease protein